MNQDFIDIIEESILAPSGENCQPWKFKIIDSKIFLYNVPEKDQSIYNFCQKGSYVAHGALLENILICASHYGYEANFSLFPDSSEVNLVSIINLKHSNKEKDSLYNFIKKRCTNRKSYKTDRLSDTQIESLKKSYFDVGSGQINFIHDRNDMAKLSEAMSVSDRLIFENKNLHNFFFSHISWTKEEDEIKGSGFYIKTLELLPIQIKALKIFKNWVVLRIFNMIGISRIIAKDNQKRYMESGSFGAIVVSGSSNEDFVNAGRMMQRLWLKATEMGLSIQPCTGVLFFMLSISSGSAENFTNTQKELIKSAYDKISFYFGAQGKVIPMMFRVGYAEEPTARASRTRPEIIK